MRDRQLCAVTLAAASVPALLYLPRLGWVRATAAAAISALLLGLCGRRCAPGGLTEVIPAAFGRAGRAVHALVLFGERHARPARVGGFVDRAVNGLFAGEERE